MFWPLCLVYGNLLDCRLHFEWYRIDLTRSRPDYRSESMLRMVYFLGRVNDITSGLYQRNGQSGQDASGQRGHDFCHRPRWSYSVTRENKKNLKKIKNNIKLPLYGKDLRDERSFTMLFTKIACCTTSICALFLSKCLIPFSSKPLLKHHCMH